MFQSETPEMGLALRRVFLILREVHGLLPGRGPWCRYRSALVVRFKQGFNGERGTGVLGPSGAQPCIVQGYGSRESRQMVRQRPTLHTANKT